MVVTCLQNNKYAFTQEFLCSYITSKLETLKSGIFCTVDFMDGINIEFFTEQQRAVHLWMVSEISKSVSQKANCLPRFLEKVFTSCFDLPLTYSHNKYG